MKRLPLATYRQQHRGGRGVMGMNMKEGDYIEHLHICSTHDYMLFFTNRGKVYRSKVYELPEGSRTSKGSALVNVLPLSEGERVMAVIPTRDFKEEKYLVCATAKGQVKKTEFIAYNTPIRADGIIAIKIRKGDELVQVRLTSGRTTCCWSRSPAMPRASPRSWCGRWPATPAGVKGMNVSDKDNRVLAMDVARDDTELFVVTENGYGKRTAVSEYPVKGRGTKGVLTAKLTTKKGGLAGALIVREHQELLFISQNGMVQRTTAGGISQMGRPTQGVRVMNMKDDDRVSAVALVVESGEAPEIEPAAAGARRGRRRRRRARRVGHDPGGRLRRVEQLRGRNALITGAAGGLGGYIARALAAEGVNLALSDLAEAPQQALARRAQRRRDAGASRSPPTSAIARRPGADRPGRGGDRPARHPRQLRRASSSRGHYLERTEEEILALLEVNLTATMLLDRAVLPGMLERRARTHRQHRLAGREGRPASLASYAASKHGVVGFSHSLRAELADTPVGVSVICPGFVARVGMYGRFSGAPSTRPGPLRPIQPEQVADAVVKAIREDRAGDDRQRARHQGAAPSLRDRAGAGLEALALAAQPPFRRGLRGRQGGGAGHRRRAEGPRLLRLKAADRLALLLEWTYRRKEVVLT